MNRQYESMTRVRLGPYVVRVWREESSLSTGLNNDIRLALQAVITFEGVPSYQETMRKVAAILDQLPRISAYEILDVDGDGAIVYSDWP